MDTYLTESAHVSNNMWYKHMSKIGKDTTKDNCHVCSLIPYTMSASRTFVATEIPATTAECLLYLALFQTRGRFQGKRATLRWKSRSTYPYEDNFIKTLPMFDNSWQLSEGLQYRTDGPDKGETKEVTLSYLPCQWSAREVGDEPGCWERPLILIYGKVYTKNGWVDRVVGSKPLTLTKSSLVIVQEENDKCYKEWTKSAALVTWLVKEEEPITIIPLTAPTLCYHHDGEIDVGTNEGCKRTIKLPEGGCWNSSIDGPLLSLRSKGIQQLATLVEWSVHYGTHQRAITSSNAKGRQQGELP
ncbi:uncharacterized protein [Ambystoma mexicanum]|uniref:uncharacterized protein n=1 Tax=Ambystoma mexicanum TaxID=8296 RepID=UPI0037E7DEAC